jgi:hypothetical protein
MTTNLDITNRAQAEVVNKDDEEVHLDAGKAARFQRLAAVNWLFQPPCGTNLNRHSRPAMLR